MRYERYISIINTTNFALYVIQADSTGKMSGVVLLLIGLAGLMATGL